MPTDEKDLMKLYAEATGALAALLDEIEDIEDSAASDDSSDVFWISGNILIETLNNARRALGRPLSTPPIPQQPEDTRPVAERVLEALRAANGGSMSVHDGMLWFEDGTSINLEAAQ